MRLVVLQLDRSRSVRLPGTIALALLLGVTAPAAAALPQDDAAAERLDRMTRLHAGLVSDSGPEDPSALAGEFILLAGDLAQLDRSALPEASRIDYDILDWRLDLGIAAEMEDELTSYELALLRHTGERQNPEALHALGIREVERLRGEMEALVHRYDAELDLAEFLDAARTDERLYAGSQQELVSHTRRTANRIQSELPTLFHEELATRFQIVTPGDRDAPRYMAWYQGPGRGRAAYGFVVLTPIPLRFHSSFSTP